MDVLIPTCKSYGEIIEQIADIKTFNPDLNVIYTCFNKSAAENRNLAHSQAKSDIVISLDDDITGFYQGWEKDLIAPLLMNPQVRFCSARLLKPDGKTPNFMMTSKMQTKNPFEIVPRCPTSAFAYRKKEFDSLIGFWNKASVPFDETFKGSGWEDNSICHDLVKKYPDTLIMINNTCKLIHINEEKNQKKYLQENREYFFKSGRGER